ncbi:MAG: hypothetical protein FWG78_05055 [Coriobacteriia bacterium]|nr:hypothetical protein [Coriobacteriia bacterium]
MNDNHAMRGGGSPLSEVEPFATSNTSKDVATVDAAIERAVEKAADRAAREALAQAAAKTPVQPAPIIINDIGPDAEIKKSHKRQNALITIIIALLLLLLGAFAWGTIQGAINQVANNTQAEALLVDEFARKDDRSWDKLVRIDNVGTMPFVARISAAEFMQWISAQDWSAGQNIDPAITTFAPLIPSAEATMSAALDAPLGTLIDTQTVWFDVAPDMWSIRGLTNATSLAQAAPTRGHVANGMPFTEFWRWTQPHIMSYAQWEVATPAARAGRWVLADDGYFYYTSVIPAGGRSNPLMTALVAAPGFDPASAAFYYAIDLHMEVVTRDDVDIMKDGGTTRAGNVDLRAASAEGKAILDAMTWGAPSILDLTINGESISVVGNTLTVTSGSATPTLAIQASATGAEPLTYLWQRKDASNEWEAAPGLNTSAIYYTSTSTLGTTIYRALASNSGAVPEAGDEFTSISDEIVVEVVINPVPTPVIPAVPVTDLGIPLFKIAEYHDGTYAYELLITRFLYGNANPQADYGAGVAFNPAGEGNFWLTQSDGTTKSGIMTGMDNWYNAVDAPALKAIAVEADFTGSNTGASTTRIFGVESVTGADDAYEYVIDRFSGSTATIGTWVWIGDPNLGLNMTWVRNPNNWKQALSMPSNRTAASANSQPGGTGIVAFPLSGKEVFTYFPDIYNGAPTARNETSATVLGRRAFRVAANHTEGTAVQWLLRSRGDAASNIGMIDTGGGMDGSWGALEGTNGLWMPSASGYPITLARGLRPALWVRR